ncbi:DUF1963 domain-containing protein [Sphingopyxis sp. H115]|uniref:DUF1963 domain-containing protein n=1 Tax=Sphingopyxis sp. H115 TaxID=1759073 RepID=UPI000737A139|nr:DUF1963 domain-containing protein [Sphingopyxis sp. H115]KTE06140.1 hypothetical protein ATE71_16930 [Sphingopyxis sp. H115]
MNQLQSAALTLAGAVLVFAAILFAIWWMRRPRTAPAAPRAPRAPRPPGESRLPKLSRTAKPEYEDVEIAPERLARIRRKTAPSLLDAEAQRLDPEPLADIESETIDAALDLVAEQVERDTQRASAPVDASLSETLDTNTRDPDGTDTGDAALGEVTLRLVPQIPPRDAILTTSWLGGRPRLPRGMEWPAIGGEPAIFLAQVDCTGLPLDLWQGIGPRDGSLAFFVHPRSADMRVFHLRDTDVAYAPPVPLDQDAGWFEPYGDRSSDGLVRFAVRAFPEWPVDLVALRPGDADLDDTDATDASDNMLFERGYDIADPAFHPFDWGSMTAMVALLEMRLDRLETDPAPVAGDEGTIAESEHRAAINREARARAEEIIAIVHDSAARDAFAPGDATAVMSALHAIRWAKAVQSVDPETGDARVETITLPLTTHRPDADLWVHDYQTILFDRAKHAWCGNPSSLSAPARAFFEPRWRDLAARATASMGGVPSHSTGRHNEAVLIDLPTSALMSHRFGSGGHLVVTIDKAALAAGDFSAPRAALID